MTTPIRFRAIQILRSRPDRAFVVAVLVVVPFPGVPKARLAGKKVTGMAVVASPWVVVVSVAAALHVIVMTVVD